MVKNRITTETAISLHDYWFFQCPECSHLEENPQVNKAGNSICSKCKKEFPSHKFKEMIGKKRHAKCEQCNKLVPLDRDHLDCYDMYVCSCSNIVAGDFEGQDVSVQEIRKLQWNMNITNGAILVKDDIFMAKTKTEKDFFLLYLIRREARKEMQNFLGFESSLHNAVIIFDKQADEYLGYITWHMPSEEEKDLPTLASLMQMFVVKHKRNQGIGTKALETWVANFADKIHDKYAINKPNKKMRSIIVNLGHVKIVGTQVVPVKCHFYY